MKTQILSLEGKKTREINLPSCFSAKIRNDIVSKVLEAKKTMQPYGTSPMAGKKHAADGKIVHRRKVWRSGYGRGQSRVPRKIFSQRGSNFNWEASDVPSARGGRRAHPPKPISMVNTLKINKKELSLAMLSAISSTANKKEIIKKYETIEEKELKNVPFVVDSKIASLKTKKLIESLNKILGKDLFDIMVKKKTIRSGKGKLRGRKYKSNAGAILILGGGEKIKTNIMDVQNAKDLGINDLAKGGAGRLAIYTEKAIKDLGEKFGGKK